MTYYNEGDGDYLRMWGVNNRLRWESRCIFCLGFQWVVLSNWFYRFTKGEGVNQDVIVRKYQWMTSFLSCYFEEEKKWIKTNKINFLIHFLSEWFRTGLLQFFQLFLHKFRWDFLICQPIQWTFTRLLRIIHTTLLNSCRGELMISRIASYLQG